MTTSSLLTKNIRTTTDLLVIGSGILGLSTAAAAVQRGLQVIVIDRSPTAAQGATVRNFGLLTSMYADNSVWGHRATESRKIYERWAKDRAVHFTRTGALQLAETEAQLALLQAYAALPEIQTKGVKFLSPRDIQDIAPAVSVSSVLGALHFPQDGLIEPRALAYTLPAYLSSKGVRFVWGDSAIQLTSVPSSSTDSSVSKSSIGGSVSLTTIQGKQFTARNAVVCTGDDALSLLPGLLMEEASKLRFCKLQMTRIRLPSEEGGILPLPVTSGLSLRRYPALAAAVPREHANMMKIDGTNPDVMNAEKLGIHIIARPAGNFARGDFGELQRSEFNKVQSTDQPLRYNEVILGDTHQYASLTGPTAGTLDEVIDEQLTNSMLYAASPWLSGIQPLLEQRKGYRRSTGSDQSSGSTNNSTSTNKPVASLLQQWHGVYLDHTEGIFRTTVALRSGGEGAQNYDRLPSNEIRGNRGLVTVVTGIGGKGMTMGPAIGEEVIAELWD